MWLYYNYRTPSLSHDSIYTTQVQFFHILVSFKYFSIQSMLLRIFSLSFADMLIAAVHE